MILDQIAADTRLRVEAKKKEISLEGKKIQDFRLRQR